MSAEVASPPSGSGPNGAPSDSLNGEGQKKRAYFRGRGRGNRGSRPRINSENGGGRNGPENVTSDGVDGTSAGQDGASPRRGGGGGGGGGRGRGGMRPRFNNRQRKPSGKSESEGGPNPESKSEGGPVDGRDERNGERRRNGRPLMVVVPENKLAELPELKPKLTSVAKRYGLRIAFSPDGAAKQVIKLSNGGGFKLTKAGNNVRSLLGLKLKPNFRSKSFTHFLSIPFNKEVMQTNFENFRDQIITKHGNDEEANIDESLFQNPLKLHLTFGILDLHNEELETKAKETLKSCENEVKDLFKNNLKVKVKGVSFMGQSEKNCRVLYANVVENEAVQKVADRVVEIFAEKELTEKKTEVKLHITLMNSTFRRRNNYRRDRKEGEDGEPKADADAKEDEDKGDDEEEKKEGGEDGEKTEKTRRPFIPFFFDATSLLEEYKDYVFAEEITLNGIELSSVKRVDDSGFYEALDKLTLN